MAATLARALWAPERRCVALLLLALCIVFASVAGRSYQLDSMLLALCVVFASAAGRSHALGSMHTSISPAHLTQAERRRHCLALTPTVCRPLSREPTFFEQPVRREPLMP